MKEIRDIITAYKRAKELNQSMALATVVLVEGSSYRRPGARMLVTDDGQLTGAISGGCLEGDALRRALLTIAQGKNKLVTYDTTEGNDTTLGVQLGCNGIVHILFEPIDTSNLHNPVAMLGKLLEDRQTGVVITLFDLKHPSGPHPGTCLLYTQGPKHLLSASPMPDPPAHFSEVAQRVFNLKTSVFEIIDDSGSPLTLFAEWIPPALRLIVVGAGNDTIPLSRMAALLGWDVIMVDGRASHCNLSRFPQASGCRVLKAEEVADALLFDIRTAVLLMTHNYRYDLRVFTDLLLRKDLPYIGTLGPKSKLEKMYDEIEKTEGVYISTVQKEKVYGPIGLEIGAETSEEIALSILAEIQAVFSKKLDPFFATNHDPYMTSHSLPSSSEIPTHNIPSTGIIMLAAGNSSRMGQPKQLLPIGCQSLIQLLVGEAAKSQSVKTLVITGAYHQEIASELSDTPVTIVQNTDWEKGMGSSICLGMTQFLSLEPQLQAVILAVSDQPHLTTQHLDRLIKASVTSKKSIVASFYEGIVGTPVLFAKEHFSALLNLDESSGARPLLKILAHHATYIPFPLGSIDLDRWEDYLSFLAESKG